jgi:hypothetical protein
MRQRVLRLMCAAVLLPAAAQAQQSRWAAPNDPTAKFMIDMERKWAEGVCVDNGVVSELLADDFQGTSTHGELTEVPGTVELYPGPRDGYIVVRRLSRFERAKSTFLNPSRGQWDFRTCRPERRAA